MLTNMIKLKILNHLKSLYKKKQKLLPVYLIRIYEKNERKKSSHDVILFDKSKIIRNRCIF